MTEKKVALSLFWRTFFLLALLLCGGIFAWVQTLRALEFAGPKTSILFDPRAAQLRQADSQAEPRRLRGGARRRRSARK